MTITKPIASLTLDEKLYPRHTISAPNLASIMEAIRLGEQMPPIVISQKDVVIDGWHRVTSYERLYGPEYQIEVDVRTYRTKAAMLADAITLNVGRGHDLTRWDVTRCALLADDVGMDIVTLAKLLKWRPDRLAKYRDSRMGKTLDDRKLAPCKRSLPPQDQPAAQRRPGSRQRAPVRHVAHVPCQPADHPARNRPAPGRRHQPA